jgi:C4-dicarboxylate transporter DctM subunit
MFGGVSGSAIADTAAIGSLVIPSMVARGYSRGFAAACCRWPARWRC